MACNSGCPVVVDVRTQSEWDSGHLSCAHLLPVQQDASHISTIECLAGGKSADQVFVYCRSGYRAGLAKGVLDDAGFTNVTNKGGYSDVQSMNLCDCAPQNTCTPQLSPSPSSAADDASTPPSSSSSSVVSPSNAPSSASPSPSPVQNLSPSTSMSPSSPTSPSTVPAPSQHLSPLLNHHRRI